MPLRAGAKRAADLVPAWDEHQHRRFRRRTSASPGGRGSQPRPDRNAVATGDRGRRSVGEATTSGARVVLAQPYLRGTQQAAIAARLDDQSPQSGGQRATVAVLLSFTPTGDMTIPARPLRSQRDSDLRAGTGATRDCYRTRPVMSDPPTTTSTINSSEPPRQGCSSTPPAAALGLALA